MLVPKPPAKPKRGAKKPAAQPTPSKGRVLEALRILQTLCLLVHLLFGSGPRARGPGPGAPGPCPGAPGPGPEVPGSGPEA